MTKNKTVRATKSAPSSDSSHQVAKASNGTSKSVTTVSRADNSALNRTSRGNPPQRKTRSTRPGVIFSKNALILSVVAGIISVALYLLNIHWQEQKTLSPFAGAMIPYDRSYVNSLLWGTYRPGVYFGIRSRTPHSLEMGLMWFSYSASQFSLRHQCDQNDKLRYGWQEHDGRTFGYQEILDGTTNISTSFVKRYSENANDWIARLSVNQVKDPSKEASKVKTGLFIYFRLEDQGTLEPILLDGNLVGLEGSTPALGSFRLNFVTYGKPASSSFLAAQLPTATKIRDVILNGITMNAGNALKLVGQTTTTPNLIVYELAVANKLTVDFLYEPLKPDLSSAGLGPLQEGSVGELIVKNRLKFREKFRSVFRIVERGYSELENDFAQKVFSNLIGGIGYFYGHSLIASKWSNTPAKYWETGLFTAVPSRSFFPRGFLWDEGFHQLVISRWDVGLTREIMTSWLNLMNSEGWIPREQILGDEARSRVPDEFVVQNSNYANPPSFFLTIEAMLDGLDPDKPDEVDKTLKFFEFAFPRLQKWYQWFNTTQIGSVPGSYRWRGRNETTDRELNPKTLTSGLDDYPRASHPTNDERHVDLYCWMAYGAGVLARVAEEVGENPTIYRETETFLKDNVLLDELHWSEKANSYADYGWHSENVRLQRAPAPPAKPGQTAVQMPFVRVVDKEPQLQFVNAFGYVSLFPMMLRILDANSPKLGVMLDGLRNTTHLWTEYGIRSLARSSPLFAKYNTEHDPPYWRGAVWINMNYLILKSLRYYGEIVGPYQERARQIGEELKMNLVRNMFKQWQKTGFVWEQYLDGEGKGSHPFTGWSSLIVLILSDL